jgi:hypothetical protein
VSPQRAARRMSDGRSMQPTRLLELAARADSRAARARRHALGARQMERICAGRGDRAGEILFRREAEGHERAARANELTAALHRRHATRLAARGRPSPAA